MGIGSELSGIGKILNIILMRKASKEAEKEKFQNAISAVMEAVVDTKAYLYDSKSGKVRDRERELSQKWRNASSLIREYDMTLSRSAKIKAFGWADPKEWSRTEGIPGSFRGRVFRCHIAINNEFWGY